MQTHYKWISLWISNVSNTKRTSRNNNNNNEEKVSAISVFSYFVLHYSFISLFESTMQIENISYMCSMFKCYVRSLKSFSTIGEFQFRNGNERNGIDG